MSEPQLDTRQHIPLDRVDFILSTDGSGKDGYGGYAANIVSTRHRKAWRLYGLSNQTSVPKQEFAALLAGLEVIYNFWLSEPNLRAYGPKVRWEGDAKHLIDSASRDEVGVPLQSRSSNGHLWAQYQWFETRMTIDPVYAPRNTIAAQKEADGIAGEMFIMCKTYGEAGSFNFERDPDLLFAMEHEV